MPSVNIFYPIGSNQKLIMRFKENINNIAIKEFNLETCSFYYLQQSHMIQSPQKFKFIRL